MEVDSVFAHYVMLSARVWEVVDLYVILDTFADKAQAMLPNYHRVYGSLTDQKPAFEIFRFVDEAGLGVSLWVYCRVVHVSLSVHYLIPFPVYYRTSGNCNLEYKIVTIGIVNGSLLL